MQAKKVISLCSILVLFGCFLINTNTVYARVHIKSESEQNTIIKRNVNSNQNIELDVSYLTKRTSLSESEVYNLFKKSLSKNDIKICYTLYILSNEKLDKIVDTYLDENKKLGLTLKDYNIKKKNFDSKLEKLFPSNDETNHDLVDKNKVPYRQIPPKD